MGTSLSGGIIPGATRIDAHCWVDGPDDNIIVEFWHLPGSILRTTYDRRSTRRTERFIPVDSEAFARLMMAVEPTTFCI